MIQSMMLINGTRSGWNGDSVTRSCWRHTAEAHVSNVDHMTLPLVVVRLLIDVLFGLGEHAYEEAGHSLLLHPASLRRMLSRSAGKPAAECRAAAPRVLTGARGCGPYQRPQGWLLSLQALNSISGISREMRGQRDATWSYLELTWSWL